MIDVFLHLVDQTELAKTPQKVTTPRATRTLDIIPEEEDFSTLLYCTPLIFW